jgi:hypothetical protein
LSWIDRYPYPLQRIQIVNPPYFVLRGWSYFRPRVRIEVGKVGDLSVSTWYTNNVRIVTPHLDELLKLPAGVYYATSDYDQVFIPSEGKSHSIYLYDYESSEPFHTRVISLMELSGDLVRVADWHYYKSPVNLGGAAVMNPNAQFNYKITHDFLCYPINEPQGYFYESETDNFIIVRLEFSNQLLKLPKVYKQNMTNSGRINIVFGKEWLNA